MAQLIISFSDQSNSFTYGVEFGRLLQKIEQGDDIVTNNGFPIRLENKQLIKDTCEHYGYIPIFIEINNDEWIDFIAMRTTDN
jgi:hypothetical protein